MKWQMLAGLRFFLAWIIFCSHLTWFVEADQTLLTKFSKFGGLSAVIGFLLISGYSIAHSVTRKPKGFYKRRILRLYPLYICAVILSIVPFLFSDQTIQVLNSEFRRPNLFTIIGNLFFMQGFLVAPIQSNAIVWTLSIEVFCYILAPVLIKTSTKKLIVLLSLSALFFAFYPYLKLSYYSQLQFGLGFALLFWAWLTGFVYFRYEKSSKKLHLTVMMLSLGCFLLEFNKIYNSRLSIFTYLLCCLFLVYSPFFKIPNKISHFFEYVGNISYPLYLFHLPSLTFSYAIIGIKNSFVLVFISLLTSVFFYHAIDFYSKRRYREHEKLTLYSNDETN